MDGKLKIGFDSKRAFLNTSGLGNYARNIIDGISGNFPDVSLFLFTSKEGSIYKAPSNALVITPESTVKLLHGFWRSFGISKLLNKCGADVYHGLSNELPFNISSFKGKKIVTIHDLIFKRFPDWYPFFDRYVYDLKSRSACNNADTVVAISEQTRSDIIQYYRISPEKIKVVHQPVAQRYFDHSLKLQPVKGLHSGNFLLYVGTVEPRKDLLTLLKAASHVRNCPPVVVVGKKNRDYFSKVIQPFIEENALRGSVIFPENIGDSDLLWLYRNCTAFVYPSVFEGWGLPVVEAMASGSTVITTAKTTMAEAGGEACLYFTAGNEEELASKISQVLEPGFDRESFRKKALTRAELFHPAEAVRKLMEIYTS